MLISYLQLDLDQYYPSPIDLRVYAKDNSQELWTGETAVSEVTYKIPKTSTIFRFCVRKIRINLKFTGQVEMHSFENTVKFRLKNLTTNLVVAEKIWTTEIPARLEIDEVISCKIKSNNEYELFLFAEVKCDDNTTSLSSELNLNMTSY